MIQNVACRALIFLLAVFRLLPVLPAQSPRVYKSRIEPHWITGGPQFWYRNDLPNEEKEFILVDPEAGSRQRAFDHKRLAEVMSKETGRNVLASQLPIRSILFSDNMATVFLTGRSENWNVDLESYELTSSNPDGSPHNNVAFVLPTRKSTDRGGDVEFVVKNELAIDVQLIWINRSGQPTPYGTVKAGESKTQHTFAGHVWLLKNAAGKSLSAFEVKEHIDEIVVSDETLSVVKDSSTKKRPADTTKARRKTANGISPDGTMVAYADQHNLWLRSIPAERTKPTALTVDATPKATFRNDTSRGRLINMQYNLEAPPADIANVKWSPDSQYVLAIQTKKVPEPRVHYVESSPKKKLQPELKSYPYAKPGDPIPTSIPRLFRIHDGHEIVVSNELFPDPFELRFVKWSDDSSRFWLRYNERGHQVMRVLEVTAKDGRVRTIIDEHSDTFIHYSDRNKAVLEWLPNKQLLWASERSGWNHLFRYDVKTGKVVNAVTQGEWNVRRIERIDRDKQQIWFYAVGIMKDQDPYHEHFCRISFDGSNLEVLTEGDGTHEVTFSPDRKFILDRFSRVDLPPVTELRRSSDGRLVTRLETSNASELIAGRGSLPLRFHATGRDGETDIWGIIHLPRHFDASKRYPIVENIYAGPHDFHVPKAFRSRYRHQHQIADRGIMVVQIDGMGTAWRSKKFHDVCHKNLKDGGFPDRIAWMKAAAEKFPWLDVSRVGIYGGSAGGQNAMAAVLWHGSFYKAAVADCGCHDNRMDKLWWNEQWMGRPGDGSYVASSNMENAYRLQGKLMLVVGELDRNVDPASTTQVVGKLLEAEKEFDFLLVPGAGHGACERPFPSRRRADFLARHLSATTTSTVAAP